MSLHYFSLSVLVFLGCSSALASLCPCESSPNSRSWEHIYENNSQTIVPLFSFGNKNYYLGNIKKVPRFEAEQICKDIHMDLVSVESKEENDFIHQYLSTNAADDGYWSGGTRLIDGKTWIWLSNGKRMNYTSWKPGRPVGTLNRCVYMIQEKNGGLLWFDQACEIKYFFVCERCKAKTNSTTGGLPVTYVDGKRYLRSTTKVNYYQATELCRVYGMELLTITDQKKTDAVRKLLANTNANEGLLGAYRVAYWTSGNKMSDAKTWTWSNGDPITYTNWAARQPDNMSSNELCIDVYKNAEWNDQNCNIDEYFICQDIDFDNCCN